MTCAGELKVPSVFGSVVRSNEMFGRISFCKVYQVCVSLWECGWQCFCPLHVFSFPPLSCVVKELLFVGDPEELIDPGAKLSAAVMIQELVK